MKKGIIDEMQRRVIKECSNSLYADTLRLFIAKTRLKRDLCRAFEIIAMKVIDGLTYIINKINRILK